MLSIEYSSLAFEGDNKSSTCGDPLGELDHGGGLRAGFRRAILWEGKITVEEYGLILTGDKI